MKDGWQLVVLLIILFASGFAFGFSTVISVIHKPLQDAAVERGYAEWVAPEAGRGKTVLQWVD